MPNWGALEKIVQQPSVSVSKPSAPSSKPNEPNWGSLASMVEPPKKTKLSKMSSVVSGVQKFGADVARTPGMLADLSPAVDVARAVLPEGFYDPQVAQDLEARSRENEQISKMYPGESLWSLLGKGEHGKAASYLGHGVLINAPSIGLSMIGGGAGKLVSSAAKAKQLGNMVLGILGATASSAKRQELLGEGVHPTIAAGRGAVSGAIEIATERMGTFKALERGAKALTKSMGQASARQLMADFGKVALTSAGIEGIEEVVAEGGNAFSDFVFGDKNAFDKIGPRIFDAFALGAASGGVVTGPVAMGLASRSQKLKATFDKAKVPMDKRSAIIETMGKASQAQEAKRVNWTKAKGDAATDTSDVDLRTHPNYDKDKTAGILSREAEAANILRTSKTLPTAVNDIVGNEREWFKLTSEQQQALMPLLVSADVNKWNNVLKRAYSENKLPTSPLLIVSQSPEKISTSGVSKGPGEILYQHLDKHLTLDELATWMHDNNVSPNSLQYAWTDATGLHYNTPKSNPGDRTEPGSQAINFFQLVRDKLGKDSPIVKNTPFMLQKELVRAKADVVQAEAKVEEIDKVDKVVDDLIAKQPKTKAQQVFEKKVRAEVTPAMKAAVMDPNAQQKASEQAAQNDFTATVTNAYDNNVVLPLNVIEDPMFSEAVKQLDVPEGAVVAKPKETKSVFEPRTRGAKKPWFPIITSKKYGNWGLNPKQATAVLDAMGDISTFYEMNKDNKKLQTSLKHAQIKQKIKNRAPGVNDQVAHKLSELIDLGGSFQEGNSYENPNGLMITYGMFHGNPMLKIRYGQDMIIPKMKEVGQERVLTPVGGQSIMFGLTKAKAILAPAIIEDDVVIQPSMEDTIKEFVGQNPSPDHPTWKELKDRKREDNERLSEIKDVIKAESEEDQVTAEAENLDEGGLGSDEEIRSRGARSPQKLTAQALMQQQLTNLQRGNEQILNEDLAEQILKIEQNKTMTDKQKQEITNDVREMYNTFKDAGKVQSNANVIVETERKGGKVRSMTGIQIVDMLQEAYKKHGKARVRMNTMNKMLQLINYDGELMIGNHGVWETIDDFIDGVGNKIMPVLGEVNDDFDLNYPKSLGSGAVGDVDALASSTNTAEAEDIKKEPNPIFKAIRGKVAMLFKESWSPMQQLFVRGQLYIGQTNWAKAVGDDVIKDITARVPRNTQVSQRVFGLMKEYVKHSNTLDPLNRKLYFPPAHYALSKLCGMIWTKSDGTWGYGIDPKTHTTWLTNEDIEFVEAMKADHPELFDVAVSVKNNIWDMHRKWIDVMNIMNPGSQDLAFWESKHMEGYFHHRAGRTLSEQSDEFSYSSGMRQGSSGMIAEKRARHDTWEEFLNSVIGPDVEFMYPDVNFAQAAGLYIADHYDRLVKLSYISDITKVIDPKTNLPVAIFTADPKVVKVYKETHGYKPVGKFVRWLQSAERAPSGSETTNMWVSPDLETVLAHLFKPSQMPQAMEPYKNFSNMIKQFVLSLYPLMLGNDFVAALWVQIGLLKTGKLLKDVVFTKGGTERRTVSHDVLDRILTSGGHANIETIYQMCDRFTRGTQDYILDDGVDKNLTQKLGAVMSNPEVRLSEKLRQNLSTLIDKFAPAQKQLWAFTMEGYSQAWLATSEKFEKRLTSKGMNQVEAQATADRLASLTTSNTMMLMNSYIMSKNMKAWMSVVLLATSYTWTQIRMLTGALPLLEKVLPFQSLKHSVMNKQERVLITNHYANHLIKGFFGNYMAALFLNLAFGGRPPWENEEGHRLDIDITHLIGEKDGKRQYIELATSRQFYAALKILPEEVGKMVGLPYETGTIKWWNNKIAPVSRAILDLRSNVDYAGNEIVHEGATFTENMLNAAQFTASNITPRIGKFGSGSGIYSNWAEVMAPFIVGGSVTSGIEGGTEGRQALLGRRREEYRGRQVRKKTKGVPKGDARKAVVLELLQQGELSPRSLQNYFAPKLPKIRRDVQRFKRKGLL